jgi:hypothetical protein
MGGYLTHGLGIFNAGPIAATRPSLLFFCFSDTLAASDYARSTQQQTIEQTKKMRKGWFL